MRARAGAEGTVVKPRGHSHGLTGLAYYRPGHAVSVVRPRPVRLVVARAAMRPLPTHPTQWFNFFDVRASPRAAV